MSEQSWDDERVSSAVARRIDALCEQFEAEMRAGRRPAVEDFVQRHVSAEEFPNDLQQTLLIPELIAIEVQYRAATGETDGPDEADYKSRYPKWAEEVTRLIDANPPPPGAAPQTPVPQRLREYELLEIIGRGGMGTVYKARHTMLDQIRALKLLPANLMQDEHSVARFERENRVVGKFDHANIVRATDAGEIDGVHFLVMEHVDGIDLAHLSQRLGPLKVADACDLIRQAAEGLQHAHEHELVHRDVKPSNLMLTRQGVVKVLDFGLARLREDRALGPDLTGAGQVMGTLEYMAPEQARDTHSVDIRADLYALGCTLFKLLSGRSPFNDGRRNATAVVYAHANEPPPDIRHERSDVPDEVAEILERLLQKHPGDRFAEPVDLAEALWPFAVGSDLPGLVEQAASAARVSPPKAPGVKRSSAPVGGRAEAATVKLSDVQSTETKPHPVSRRRWIWGAAFVVALGVAGVALYLPKRPPQPVDLLGLVDLRRDTVAGRWELQDGALVSPDSPMACLHIGYELPDEYRLRIQLQRESGATLLISAVQETTPWTIEFSIKARLVANDGPAAASGRSRRLSDGTWDMMREEPSWLVVTVRRTGLQATRDGQTIAKWDEDYSKLAGDRPAPVPDWPGLSLVTDRSEYRFQTVLIEPLDER